jgi:hypothetical protein
MSNVFTPDQVARLNRWQNCCQFHPLTCQGGDDCPSRELIATTDGWVCACGSYHQNWAHSFMLDREPPTPPWFRGKDA